MDNFNDEKWISLSEPIMAESVQIDTLKKNDIQNNEKDKLPKKKISIKAPIVTFQLILCLCVLLFLFLSKTFLPDLFTQFKKIYIKELNSTLYSDGNFKDSSYNELFNATEDEVQ